MSDQLASVIRRSSLGPFIEAAEHSPYFCTGPAMAHEPTDDNPMRTGRCNACRAFIGLTNKGWRSVTRSEAFRWGLFGARRRPIERTF